jgi:hypothetical protein
LPVEGDDATAGGGGRLPLCEDVGDCDGIERAASEVAEGAVEVVPPSAPNPESTPSAARAAPTSIGRNMDRNKPRSRGPFISSLFERDFVAIDFVVAPLSSSAHPVWIKSGFQHEVRCLAIVWEAA